VRWRTVSAEEMSPSGKNSDSSVRVRRYGSEAPIFATTRSYSGEVDPIGPLPLVRDGIARTWVMKGTVSVERIYSSRRRAVRTC
jgi:hypothetical protein